MRLREVFLAQGIGVSMGKARAIARACRKHCKEHSVQWILALLCCGLFFFAIVRPIIGLVQAALVGSDAVTLFTWAHSDTCYTDAYSSQVPWERHFFEGQCSSVRLPDGSFAYTNLGCNLVTYGGTVKICPDSSCSSPSCETYTATGFGVDGCVATPGASWRSQQFTCGSLQTPEVDVSDIRLSRRNSSAGAGEKAMGNFSIQELERAIQRLQRRQVGAEAARQKDVPNFGAPEVGKAAVAM